MDFHIGPRFSHFPTLNVLSQPSPSSLFTLLTSALRAHASLVRAAVTGRGIDRHLLGLRCILDSEWDWLDSETPSDVTSVDSDLLTSIEPVALFEDPIFWKSQTWRLSTSGLSEGWHFRGTG